MWGNLQGILSMLAGQGCSPHVQDMVHQIAVHFANEQSHSVALERRLTGNIAREKDAQKRTQQQLQGGIQVGLPRALLLHRQTHFEWARPMPYRCALTCKLNTTPCTFKTF